MEQIVNGGSNRKYYRVVSTDGTTIHVEGTVREENHAFITMAHHFRAQGLPVPDIYWVSDDEMQYDQEDLGDLSLFDYIANGRQMGAFSNEEVAALQSTIRAIAHFQIEGDKGLDYSVCYPQPAFNRRSVMWDMNYFKYCFLKTTGVEFLEDRLEDEFERMVDVLLMAPLRAFMYRDCQSRNVMWRDGQPWFIDFQGGRKGPVYYDVASFLWQAKANLPQVLRDELVEVYLDELETLIDVDRDDFKHYLKQFVFFRTLQVLGAYGYRGYFEKKQHFTESIPFAIKNLKQILPAMQETYPYLCEVLENVETGESKTERGIRKEDRGELMVTVYSFSYKKGIPEDVSGNGGGFVFDCRATHNPGKYDAYKQLTGIDEAVIRFIEDDGEMKPFMEAAYQLVDQSVKRYLERGFSSLMVSFGCTGGQHRSVYGAEHMAQHIHEKFGVKVRLVHREQKVERVLQ